MNVARWRSLLVLGLVALTVGAMVLAVSVMAAVGGSPPSAPSDVVPGIRPIVLASYWRGAVAATELVPECTVRWTVLAAIGQVESRHVEGRAVKENEENAPRRDERDEVGRVDPAVVGIALDGRAGTRAVPDTDDGRLDGDEVWDRAVGPLQFIPSTWATTGLDGSGDGVADPQNVYDGALSAGVYLCRAVPGDYTDADTLGRALYAYNHSDAYVATVLRWVEFYDAWATDADSSYGVPVARELLLAAPSALARPHHDYPAWDFPTPAGTPVFAVSAGTVVATTGTTDDCGLGVVVRGVDGWTYTYCHGSDLVVTDGTPVGTGQLLMLSGSTGHSTGPHLHLQVAAPDGHLVCPQPLLEAWLAGIAMAPASAPATGCIGSGGGL